MILNLGSAVFNAETASGGGTPAWGTEMGQGDGYRFNFENSGSLLTSLVYNSIPNPKARVKCPLGKGGNASDDYEFVICGHYTNVFVNGEHIPNATFDLLVVKKLVGANHVGRRTLKYNPRITLDGNSNNANCYELMAKTLGVSNQGAWFVSEINTLNQDELHFTAHVLDKDKHFVFKDSSDRSKVLSSFLDKDIFKEIERVASIKAEDVKKEPLQQIYYGAPGTGKSFKIDSMTNDANSVRTTFHPDSDYASFVGAYKPTMQLMPIHAFVGTTVHHANDANNGKAYEQKIVYKYVPQAFLKAYVGAWKDLENPHFLIIEEINRGNCAQIFGDLFQLLDRNSQGASSYAIIADDDISQFLATDDNGFANLPEETADAIRSFILRKDNGQTLDIGADILSGKKLLLPPNLYIWATMNTSDQSLFPIDSAFKRRWNWEYIPIRFFENDSDPSLRNRSFEVGNTRYSWADFLKIINPIISELTESADKQMGFFFAKPDKKSDPSLNDNDIISEKIFLNKVLFYLWTDVLKDFNVGREEFKKPDGKNLEFADFFSEGNTYLADFVAKLGVAVVDYDESAIEKAEKGYKPISVTINGQKFNTITSLFYEIMRQAATMQPYAEIEKALRELLPNKELTIKPIDDAPNYQKENRWNKTPLAALDGQAFVVTNQWSQSDLPNVKKAADYFHCPFEAAE